MISFYYCPIIISKIGDKGDKIIIRTIREVPMTITDCIEIDPGIMMGKPVIRGTRITVELILRKLSEGASEADILDACPKLSARDIQAAVRHFAGVSSPR